VTPSYQPEFELRTARLVLRPWRPEDRAGFAALNADPVVMEFFPSVLTRAESDALVDRFKAEFAERGFCPWAVEESASGSFIGFVGLHAVPSQLTFAPAIEVGWRLARRSCGHGYAVEAATAAMKYGYESICASEIVSFTSALNLRSRRVMERLGMTREPAEDFEYPGLAVGHPLRPHVLYRLARRAWSAQ
jgi:ribosomal-protein-alanine N-acetyltransferase